MQQVGLKEPQTSPKNGLVSFVSNAEIERRKEEEQRRRQEYEQETDGGFTTNLAAHIRKAYERNRRAFLKMERRMLDCLRARRGEYDPDTLAEIHRQGGSAIYMMLTATKCRAAKAWLRDILLPGNDKAWGIEASPLPDPPPQIMGAIRARVQAKIAELQASGAEIDPQQVGQQLQEYLKKVVKEEAKKNANLAAENMEKLIDDQLTEGNFYEGFEEFLDDFVTFPVAYMKGPVPRHRPVLEWTQDFMPTRGTKIVEEFERVSPFDLFPAPGATKITDGDLCERIRIDPQRLYDCQFMPGYNKDAVRAALADYGRQGLREWRHNDYERSRLEDKEELYTNSPGDIEGVHFWGGVQGTLLLEWGFEPSKVPDPLAFYEIDGILVGRHVIRVKLNQDALFRRPYYKASWQPVPGSWYGEGLPELMEDVQRICNAVARGIANNVAISSGPMVEVYQDRLAEGEDARDLYPWRIFYVVDSESGNNNRAVSFFQPQSNANELMTVYERFELKADDATNIPRYAYGNERVGGAGQTMGGLSMLMESAAKGIRDAIAGIDKHVTRPIVERMWYRNMIYHNDPSVKGDLRVVPRGAAVLVAKDATQQRIVEAMGMTNNPVDIQLMGMPARLEMLRQWFKAAGLPTDQLPTIEDLKQQLAAQAKKPNPEQQKLEAEAQATVAGVKLSAAELELERQKHTDQMRLETAELGLKRYEIQMRSIGDRLNRAEQQIAARNKQRVAGVGLRKGATQ